MPHKEKRLSSGDMCPWCNYGQSLVSAGTLHDEKVVRCHQCHRFFYENGTRLTEEEKEEFKSVVAESWKAHDEKLKKGEV